MTMKMNEFLYKVHCAALSEDNDVTDTQELKNQYAKLYLFYAGQEDDAIAEADVEIDKMAKEVYLKLKSYFEPEEVTPEDA